MTDSGHIIAVDGGGSTCRVAVATLDGRVMATEAGPSANASTSLERAVATIRDTVEKAWERAGLPQDKLPDATAYLGLAGVKNAQIAQAVADAFPATHVTVAEDRATTMAGALGHHDGYVAAIGTGSFIGRQVAGEQRFIGGWGLQLGDQASGAWLGRELLSAVLEWQDGLREASDLLECTFNNFGRDTSAIIAFAAIVTPRELAERAPLLLEAAGAGDPAAVEIVRKGAAYIQQALNSLGFRAGDSLCLIGGIGARYAPYLDAIYNQNIAAPLGSALDGAIRLAIASHTTRQDSR